MKKLILFFYCIGLWFVVVCTKKYQSRVMTDTLYSNVLKAKRAYTVYLPKSFEQDKNKMYPVLYLLHGMWEKMMYG